MTTGRGGPTRSGVSTPHSPSLFRPAVTGTIPDTQGGRA
jgi:hypothetical protein